MKKLIENCDLRIEVLEEVFFVRQLRIKENHGGSLYKFNEEF
jgi:hypothetical protein